MERVNLRKGEGSGQSPGELKYLVVRGGRLAEAFGKTKCLIIESKGSVSCLMVRTISYFKSSGKVKSD